MIDLRQYVAVNVSLAPYLMTPGHEADSANAIRYVAKAYADEPLFVIRGRDALAVPVISAYMDQCHSHYLSPMASQVLDHLSRFVEWQATYAQLTRLPDPYRRVGD